MKWEWLIASNVHDDNFQLIVDRLQLIGWEVFTVLPAPNCYHTKIVFRREVKDGK